MRADVRPQPEEGPTRMSIDRRLLDWGLFFVIAGAIPLAVQLELTTNDNLAGGSNFGLRGLTKVGSRWQSANLASATHRLVLTTSANVGSLELDPEGGSK